MKYYYECDEDANYMRKHFGVNVDENLLILSMGGFMPQPGDQYIFTAAHRREKPKYGTQIYRYKKRESQGCQLHGDLLGYNYIFLGEKLNEYHPEIRMFVRYDDDDKIVGKDLNERIFSNIGFPIRRNGKLFIAPWVKNEAVKGAENDKRP